MRLGRAAAVATLDGEGDEPDKIVRDVGRNVGRRGPDGPRRSVAGARALADALDRAAGFEALEVVPAAAGRAVPERVQLGVVEVVELALAVVANACAQLAKRTRLVSRS